MCPPRSPSTVDLKPPGGLDVEDKPWLAFLSGPVGPQENIIKVADLFRLDNAGGSDKQSLSKTSFERWLGAATRRQERQPTYRGTSITVGPWLSNPSRNALPNSFKELTRVPGTPRPFAKSTQSRSGRPISNRFRTRSEERRVGKECRTTWSPDEKNKHNNISTLHNI